MPLEAMIRAVLERDGKEAAESTVVALHCQQMREWGTRGGNLEFRPIQDDDKHNRLKFIARQHDRNSMSDRLNYVMDAFTCRGEICWFFLPDPSSPGDYLIDFFVGGLNHPDPEFKVYYKPGGREIEKVIIIYTYDQTTPNFGANNKRYVTLIVTPDWIEQSESSAKVSFNQVSGGLQYSGLRSSTYGAFSGTGLQRYANPFAPDLPVRISKNNARRSGQQGSDDFYWVRGLIERHESLVSKAHDNLEMFSNPTMVTTRSASEVLETGRGNVPETWASANRYVDNVGDYMSGSTNPADSPAWGMARTPTGFLAGGPTSTGSGSIAKIIGGVGDGERFGFIQSDAVSGDQNLWIKQIRESIHWILGGIDPLGISSSITFAESRTLFGRVQNTADLKASALYGKGLCEVYSQIIAHEEGRFRAWLLPILKQRFPQQFAKLVDPSQLTDDICQQIARLAKEGQIDLPQPDGLLPFGDRTVTWRFTREVFQLTTREELDRSIAARNEREDGLSQEWVLRKQYPDMTDQEIRNAMSGFSPRVVESANGALGSLLQLFQTFMQIPDPSPEVRQQLPKGVEPPPWGLRLGLPQLVEQAMLTLQKEISYGKPVYETDDDPPKPDLAAIASLLGVSTNVQPSSAANLPATTTGNSLSTYGLPTSVLPILAASRPDRPNGESGAIAGLPSGQGGTASRLFPSPGATISTAGGSVRDTRSGEYGSIYATEPSGFRPPIPGNGVDPSIWYLYGNQLAALATALGTNSGQQ
jgi:hypothetical protein